VLFQRRLPISNVQRSAEPEFFQGIFAKQWNATSIE